MLMAPRLEEMARERLVEINLAAARCYCSLSISFSFSLCFAHLSLRINHRDEDLRVASRSVVFMTMTHDTRISILQ